MILGHPACGVNLACHICMLVDSLSTVVLSYLLLQSVLGSPDVYDVPILLSE